VPGVGRRNEGSLADAVDERPAVPGLFGVVVAAEGVEPVEEGDVRLGPVVAVVELEMVCWLRAALGGA
jgi:hypothetical protein